MAPLAYERITYSDNTATSSGLWQYYDSSVYLDNEHNTGYSSIPESVQRAAEDDGNVFEPIQGDPEGAQYIVSYMFKEPKDPVVFVKNKKDMMALVNALLKDDKVDHKTILISKISKQYRPKQVVKTKKVKVKDLELTEFKKKKKRGRPKKD